MITRIGVSVAAGWFVGIGVSPSVWGGLGDTAGVPDEEAGGVDGVTGALVGSTAQRMPVALALAPQRSTARSVPTAQPLTGLWTLTRARKQR
jgi:hypothetical protein